MKIRNPIFLEVIFHRTVAPGSTRDHLSDDMSRSPSRLNNDSYWAVAPSVAYGVDHEVDTSITNQSEPTQMEAVHPTMLHAGGRPTINGSYSSGGQCCGGCLDCIDWTLYRASSSESQAPDRIGLISHGPTHTVSVKVLQIGNYCFPFLH